MNNNTKTSIESIIQQKIDLTPEEVKNEICKLAQKINENPVKLNIEVVDSIK